MSPELPDLQSTDTPVVRVWRATVKAGCEDAFENLTLTEGVPLLSKQPGLLAISLGSEASAAAGSDFTMITIWRSMADLFAFFGDAWEEPAPPLPGELDLLATPATAKHYPGVWAADAVLETPAS